MGQSGILVIMPQRPRHQTTETLATLNLGKLRLERRRTGKFIYARAFLQGRYVGCSTGEETLGAASKVAQTWYLEHLDRIRKGEHLHGRSFAECAEAFLTHADQTLKNEISDGQREQYHIKWNLLKKHLDGVKVADVDTAFLKRLRDTRATETTQHGTLVKPSTIQKDLVFVRLVLRYALEWLKCIDRLPEFPSFRGAMTVVTAPTPFLSLDEFTTLVVAAKARANEPGLNPRVRDQRRELYAFCMIAVGAALRVGEANSIRWQDCSLIKLDNAERQDAVRMMVLGKKSTGGKRLEAFGLYTAVTGYQRLKAWRPEAKPGDLLFLENHRDGLTKLLKDTGLYLNRDKVTRNAKCFRTSGISMWLENSKNPDYTRIAKWARTSPEMLMAWYDQNLAAKSVAKFSAFERPPYTAMQNIVGVVGSVLDDDDEL
jgi:integrase